MPRYVLPALPPAVEPFVDAFGATRARLAVLLDLAAHTGSTRNEIAERTGITRKTVLTTLQDLVRHQLVTQDKPSGPQPAHYSVQAQVVRNVLDEMLHRF